MTKPWAWLLFAFTVLNTFALHGVSAAEPVIPTSGTTPRIQIIEGRVSSGGLQIYRIPGLKQGERLYVHASIASGHLDPLVALLKPEADPAELDRQSLRNQVEALSRIHNPIEASRLLLDRLALAWNDDHDGQYDALLEVVIPSDGEYRLAVGSTLVRKTAGAFRLTTGIDAPAVLTGDANSMGPPFVYAEKDTGILERGITLITDELNAQHPIRFYHLAELAAGQTLYAHAEVLGGDLGPVLTLLDFSDKPVAYANFTATDRQAALQYRLPENGSKYRLMVTGQGPGGKPTTGSYRLRIGLNAPEILQGEGEPTGREMLQEPIPVSIGLQMHQLTEVNQKAENFGVVATLVMLWQDSRLAFDPGKVQDRFRIFEGDSFNTEMNRLGLLWPKYTLVNQQGKQWIQNRVVVVRPDGEVMYLERFTATLQAPDFDFRNFPFDKQRFYIRFDLLAPEWIFRLRELEGFSEIGEKLGEEEWVITEFETGFSRGTVLSRPVSRFNFEFEARRHIEYYLLRILLPLGVIISVSWILFFLKDYAKRVDAAGANLLTFIVFNFAISRDLPKLGYLTFLDTLLISAFLVTAVILILSVYLRRQDMQGREDFVSRVDRYVILFYPLAYGLTLVMVALLFG